MLSEHDEVLRSMQTALSSLGTVLPLEGHVTPPSRRQYARMLHLYAGFVGQMQSYVSLLEDLSHDFLEGEYEWEDGSGAGENLLDRVFGPTEPSDDDDETPGQLAGTAGPNEDSHDNSPGEPDAGNAGGPPQNVVTVRLASIWPESFRVQLHVSGLVEWIIEPRKGTHTKRENEGLMRLITGYCNFNTEAVKHQLQDALGNMAPWVDLIDLADTIDEEVDAGKRLLERDKFLARNPQGERLFGFVMFLIRTVHTLKYQFRWNAMGRDEITEYLDAAFGTLEAEAIRGIRSLPDAKREARRKTMRKAFGKRHQRLTTSRNHLLRMYKVFGAGVMLDTTWSVATELSGGGRSGTFGATLDAVLRELPLKFGGDDIEEDDFETFEDYRADIQRRGRDTLRQLLEAMDLRVVWDWIAEFLETFPADG
ncbi:hypothetical protein FPV67DRAFT_1718867 [Lyophyllum atratum]|nr:hypothetical protein FPV67DRAFT_1718867 [Lyophyllum atratum]